MLKRYALLFIVAYLMLLTGCSRSSQSTVPQDISLEDGAFSASTSSPASVPKDDAAETLARYERATKAAQSELNGKALAPDERFCVPFETGYAVLGGTQQPLTDYRQISKYYEGLVLLEEILGQSFAQLKLESAENPGLQLCAAPPKGLAVRQIVPVTLTPYGLLEATALYGEAENAFVLKVVANRVPYQPFLDGSVVEETDAYQIFVSQAESKTALAWKDDSFTYWAIVAEGTEQEQLQTCQALAAQIQSEFIKMSV